MDEENLNIKHNEQRLIKLALEKYKTLTEQAKALGISDRTLITYKKKFKIGKLNRRRSEKV